MGVGLIGRLENHKLQRTKNIAIHILLCVTTMLLIALTTFKQNKPEKIRSTHNSIEN